MSSIRLPWPLIPLALAALGACAVPAGAQQAPSHGSMPGMARRGYEGRRERTVAPASGRLSPGRRRRLQTAALLFAGSGLR